MQVGSGGDNRAHIEVAIGQSVDPPADIRRDGIIHGGMTKRASETDGAQRAVAIEEADHAEDGVLLDQ